jgi:hypothetical protein
MYVVKLSTKTNKFLEHIYPEDKNKIGVSTNHLNKVSIYFGENVLKIGESLIAKDAFILNYPFRIFIYLNR